MGKAARQFAPNRAPEVAQFGDVEAAKAVGQRNHGHRIGGLLELVEVLGKLVERHLMPAEFVGAGHPVGGEQFFRQESLILHVDPDNRGDGDDDAEVLVAHGDKPVDEPLDLLAARRQRMVLHAVPEGVADAFEHETGAAPQALMPAMPQMIFQCSLETGTTESRD